MSILRLSTGLRNTMLGYVNNKVTNGNFASDATGWTASTATLARNSGTGANSTTGYATLGTAAGYAANSTAITVKKGRWYRITYYFKRGAAGNGGIKVGTSANDATYYSSGNLTDASWTYHEAHFLVPTGASTTDLYVTMTCDDTNTQSFDELVINSDARSFQDIFYKGFVNVYKGTMPTHPDDAASSGNLLFTIYSDGTATGLTLADASGGAITKTLSETWSCTSAAAGGTATWGRLYTTGDDVNASSSTAERLDFDIGTSGAFLNMSDVTIVQGATQAISTFQLTFPE